MNSWVQVFDLYSEGQSQGNPSNALVLVGPAQLLQNSLHLTGKLPAGDICQTLKHKYRYLTVYPGHIKKSSAIRCWVCSVHLVLPLSLGESVFIQVSQSIDFTGWNIFPLRKYIPLRYRDKFSISGILVAHTHRCKSLPYTSSFQPTWMQFLHLVSVAVPEMQKLIWTSGAVSNLAQIGAELQSPCTWFLKV